jgi:two-component system, OmpR family, sensor histidine kinase QseC
VKSIRSRLFFTLLGAFAAAWVIVGLFSYQHAKKQTEELIDKDLAQSARLLEAFLEHELSEDVIHEPGIIPTKIVNIYECNITFQVWIDDRLVIRSQLAPLKRFEAPEGFSLVSIDDEPYRLFTLRNDFYKADIHVAQSINVRDSLTTGILWSIAIPFLLVLPLLVLLTSYFINRALKPLHEVAKEVETRSPNDLSPLKKQSVPVEIRVCVKSINDLLSRLRDAFKREQHFTANAAHELRTPIAALKTQAQVALRAQGVDQQHRALNCIDDGADRATRLIEQLLTMARFDPQESEKNFDDVDLCQIVKRVVAELVPHLGGKNIDLGVADCAVAVVWGFAPALTILTRNIIENAVNYTEEGGEVDISVQNHGKQAVLRVSDNGPGIDPRKRQRVFERFYRDVNHSSSVYGSGLGLSIVRRIADIHHAEIRLEEPEQGSGLIFEVRFPLK